MPVRPLFLHLSPHCSTSFIVFFPPPNLSYISKPLYFNKQAVLWNSLPGGLYPPYSLLPETLFLNASKSWDCQCTKADGGKRPTSGAWTGTLQDVWKRVSTLPVPLPSAASASCFAILPWGSASLLLCFDLTHLQAPILKWKLSLFEWVYPHSPLNWLKALSPLVGPWQPFGDSKNHPSKALKAPGNATTR